MIELVAQDLAMARFFGSDLQEHLLSLRVVGLRGHLPVARACRGFGIDGQPQDAHHLVLVGLDGAGDFRVDLLFCGGEALPLVCDVPMAGFEGSLEVTEFVVVMLLEVRQLLQQEYKKNE